MKYSTAVGLLAAGFLNISLSLAERSLNEKRARDLPVELKQIQQRYDINHDGMLDVDEFRTLVHDYNLTNRVYSKINRDR